MTGPLCCDPDTPSLPISQLGGSSTRPELERSTIGTSEQREPELGRRPLLQPAPPFAKNEKESDSLFQRYLRMWPPSLKVSKHQFFQSHPPHLPKVALLPVHFQPALAFVAKSRCHLKHGVVFISPH